MEAGKTKEEILAFFNIKEDTIFHNYSYLYKKILEAMKIYWAYGYEAGFKRGQSFNKKTNGE